MCGVEFIVHMRGAFWSAILKSDLPKSLRIFSFSSIQSKKFQASSLRTSLPSK